jgi:hypothetical protein
MEHELGHYLGQIFECGDAGQNLFVGFLAVETSIAAKKLFSVQFILHFIGLTEQLINHEIGT